jgi:uncharacterized DUF497 family protein
MVLFEWDEEKNRMNCLKHGIDFEEAMHVFDDPYALVEQDRIEDSEGRWQTIGLAKGLAVLLIAHTVREKGADHSPHLGPAGQPEGADAL